MLHVNTLLIDLKIILKYFHSSQKKNIVHSENVRDCEFEKKQEKANKRFERRDRKSETKVLNND